MDVFLAVPASTRKSPLLNVMIISHHMLLLNLEAFYLFNLAAVVAPVVVN